MDPNRWHRLDELLGAALDLPAERRAGFLSEQCGKDAELRLQAEKLLAAHQQADNFIETPAMQLTALAVADETVQTRTLQQVGRYRVVSLLGAGGMGVVYLAEDESLARKVALKILPFPFTSDHERVRRFEREARAASALNHPNIITVYEIGQADAVHYIATEYAEGETLKALFKGETLGLAEAVAIGVQIAEALVAAHAAGIIHRDIKPDNIICRRDGYVKVLDFGVAKLAQPLNIADSLSHPGLVIGTIKYMSPEQALGQTVDARTDLWGLGVVLYEMVTGQAPFKGETQAAVFDAILNRTPQPALELRPDLPEEFASIISQALEKDPERRYQNAADLRDDLLRLQQALEPAPSRFNRAARRFRRKPARRAVTVAALTVLTALLILGVWLFYRRPPVVGENVASVWTRARSIQLTNSAGPEVYPNLAGDGKSFLYASRSSGNWDIYWQRVGGTNPVNLTKDSLADDLQPVYSPDDSQIAFRSERNPKGIYVMEATSENVRRVADFGFTPSWSPDGKELVVSIDASAVPTVRNRLPSALWIVNVATGAKRLLTEGDAVQPSWSPNGHRIAFWGVHSGGGRRDIWTISAQGGAAVPVTDDDSVDINPSWSADGQYLYFASDRGGSMNFWRVKIDERTGELKGELEAVTTPSGYSQDLSFSRDGRQMAYVQKAETQNLYSIAIDPGTGKTTAPPQAIIQGTRFATDTDVSPDGELLTYSSQGERQEDIFIIRKDGSGQRQLTNDRFNDRSPRWSPDGNRLVFYSDRSGRYEVWVINLDGSGLRQLSFTSGTSVFHPFWSPDGTHIAYKQRDRLPFFFEADKPWQEQTLQQLAQMPAPQENFWPHAWSPDGRRIAGSCTYLAHHSLFLYSLATQSYEQISSFGQNPFWFSDSRRLLFIDNGRVYSVDSETKKTHEVISFPPHEIRSVCLSKDDRHLYYTLKRTEADIWMLSLEEPKNH